MMPQFFRKNCERLFFGRPDQPILIEIDLPCADGISTHRTVHVRCRQQNDLWDGAEFPF